MTVNAFLTPDSLDGEQAQLLMVAPVSLTQYVRGALEPLMDAANWEQHGAQTPEDTAAEFVQIIGEMMIVSQHQYKIFSFSPLAMGTIPLATWTQLGWAVTVDEAPDIGGDTVSFILPEGAYLLTAVLRLDMSQSHRLRMRAQLDGTTVAQSIPTTVKGTNYTATLVGMMKANDGQTLTIDGYYYNSNASSTAPVDDVTITSYLLKVA